MRKTRFVYHDARLAKCSVKYRVDGTDWGAGIAANIGSMRDFLYFVAEDLNRRLPLTDVRDETIKNVLGNIFWHMPFDQPEAVFLRSLEIIDRLSNLSKAIPRGDKYSHVCAIRSGPKRRPAFGGIVGLGLYLDPVRTFHFWWIGEPQNINAEVQKLRSKAFDWVNVSKGYAEWLGKNRD